MERSKNDILQDLEMTVAGVVDDVVSLKLEALEASLLKSLDEKLSRLAPARNNGATDTSEEVKRLQQR
ncbi:MAG TPA: hypothetical protein VGO93_01585, partial [Candidatus Xenobia bacterium]